MTPKQLYKHIETIYNHFEDFKSKMLIDNFMIIKRDNSFQGFISVTDNLNLKFKISLIYRTDATSYYRLHYEIVKNVTFGAKNGEETESYEITTGEIPQSFLNLFNPTLREFKIKIIT